MRELLRTNNPVLLDFVVVLLRDAGLSPHLADQHVSAMEGSIGVLPRRILVLDEDLSRAKRVLQDADLGQWISSDAER